MNKDIPRFILSTSLVSDAPKYEFPIQALTRTKPAATLVIESEQALSFVLLNAIEWADKYSQKQHLRVYPMVRYGLKNRRYALRKINGTNAYVENGSRGSWVPVAALSV